MTRTTQAAQLVQAIRRSRTRGMTYGELQALHVSTAPHKRLAEAAHRYLKPHESLQRARRAGRVVFVIVRATKWTA
mgnify:CR=1 FL=1